MDCKRVCFDFCSSLPGNPCDGSDGTDVFLEVVGDCASDCVVTVCVLVRVFDLTASPEPASDPFSVSSPISQFFFCVAFPSLRTAALVARWCVNSQRGQG